MRLKRLELKNVCQHRRLEWRFADGLIGIVGRNGDGKSNALNAAYAALSGDFGRHSLGKQGYVSQFAEPGEDSYVLVEAEHGGTDFVIRRECNGVRDAQWLQVGGKTYTKTKEIRQVLEEALGITPHLLDAYVFVGQWRLFSFIDTPAERAKQFAQLCGTVKAEALWKLLGAQIDADRALAEQVVDDSDDLRRQAAEYEHRIEELSLRQIPVLSDEEAASLEETLRKWSRRQEVIRELKELRQKSVDLKREYDQASRRYAECERALAEAETRTVQARSEAQEAVGKLQALDQRRRLWSGKRRIIRSLEELRPPAKPKIAAPQRSVEELDRELRKTERQQEQARRLVEACDGKPACPTCGTPADTLAPVIAKAKKVLPQLAARLEALRAERARWERVLEARQAYEKEWAVYTGRREHLERELAALADVEEPVEDVAALREVVDAYKELEGHLAEIRREAQEARAQQKAALAACEFARERMERLRKELAKLEVSLEEKEAAEARLAENRKALEERARVEGELGALRRALEDVRGRLAAMEKRLVQTRRAKAWIELLTRLREVFHRGALPALVHQTALEDLMEQVNQTLEELDAPFRMEAKDELEMLARFADGRRVPAADLSGGEKMLFAIAFRLAVSAKFASQIGLLVLDEPTACVDRQNVERLVEMFAQLGRLARSRNNQIVVVTHEELLRPVFDQVLSVPDGYR